MDINVNKVALDAIRGRIDGQYSEKKTSDSLREAFIELNGGSNKIDPKTFYRGNALFELVQEMIPVVIDEGIKNDNVLMALVDYRNINDGDENKFVSEGKSNFIVRDTAAGIQGVRRQRLADGESITVVTTPHIIKVYDGLNRFMAGRIDFNTLVDGVAKSFTAQIAADAYAVLSGITAATAGLNATYVKSGSFSESDMIELIEHVEAATGKSAHIIGTKAALSRLTTASASSELAKNDMYNLGFYGRFNGTPMICMKQAHKPGTDAFALDGDRVWIIASDEKPVKVVNEGSGIMSEKQATDNADLTQEYVYIQSYGTGMVCGEKLGIWTF